MSKFTRKLHMPVWEDIPNEERFNEEHYLNRMYQLCGSDESEVFIATKFHLRNSRPMFKTDTVEGHIEGFSHIVRYVLPEQLKISPKELRIRKKKEAEKRRLARIKAKQEKEQAKKLKKQEIEQKKARKQAELEERKKRSELGKKWTCEICGATYKRLNSSHLRKVHNMDKKTYMEKYESFTGDITKFMR